MCSCAYENRVLKARRVRSPGPRLLADVTSEAAPRGCGSSDTGLTQACSLGQPALMAARSQDQFSRVAVRSRSLCIARCSSVLRRGGPRIRKGVTREWIRIEMQSIGLKAQK